MSVLFTQSCPSLCDPMDCNLPGSSAHGVFQARILKWVAIPFSRGIFPSQESNPGLLPYRQILYYLSYQRSCSVIWIHNNFSLIIYSLITYFLTNYLYMGGFQFFAFFNTVMGSIHIAKYWYAAAAAAAKSLQSCPTLCDPIDSSPPGSPVPGILQARTLEWVAISFSNVWKWKGKVKLLSLVRLSDPMDCSLPGPPSMGFSRQEYWSGVPLPSPKYWYILG